jgi:hydroxymethylbilane synthase
VPKTRKQKPATCNLRLGTRASGLALTQSRSVARMLEQAHPGLKVELVEIRTTGDVVTNKPLASFGGRGVFVKELERALSRKAVDIAVHSLKDLPTRQPKDLVVGAIIGREDPRDAAILRSGKSVVKLPAGSVIGCGSLRRRAQLKARYPHVEFAEIRGNVETRIRKVREGLYAGTILARAGLKRLGLLAEVSQTFPLSVMLPAPGQGALAVECRVADDRTRGLLRALHNPKVAACIEAERAVLEALGGGCHLPLGALGTVARRSSGSVTLQLRTVLGAPDGSLLLRADVTGPAARPRQLGLKAARLLLEQGGKRLLTVEV